MKAYDQAVMLMCVSKKNSISPEKMLNKSTPHSSRKYFRAGILNQIADYFCASNITKLFVSVTKIARKHKKIAHKRKKKRVSVVLKQSAN